MFFRLRYFLCSFSCRRSLSVLIMRTPAPPPSTASKPPEHAFSSLFPPDAARRTVYTAAGASVDLPEFVRELAVERPVLIGWLRHFGCTLCARLAASWRESKALEESGAQIVLVGCGTVPHLRGFLQKSGGAPFGTDGAEERIVILTDPWCGTYGVLEWKRGFRSTFTWRSWREVIRSFWAGNRQTWKWWPKYPLQQGGIVLVGQGGHVLWTRTERYAGDHVVVDKLGTILSEKTCDLHQSANLTRCRC